MKNKKYHTVGTVLKTNKKMLEGGKIDTPNTYMTTHFPALIIQCKGNPLCTR